MKELVVKKYELLNLLLGVHPYIKPDNIWI